MAKILTGAEVNEIMEECRVSGRLSGYQEGSEYFGQVPALLGCGYGRSMELRPGLRLQISDIKKRQTHVYKGQHGQTMPMTLAFYLTGGMRVDNTGLKIAEEELAGKSYFYCLPKTFEVEEFPAFQRTCVVRVRILPELMPTFSDRIHELPAGVRQAIEHPQAAQLYYVAPITPAQQHVLQQILQWPYQGITRQFYLEGKVLELLALYFSQMLAPAGNKPLVARDIDRIYQARDILIQNIASPPSLPELAKRVHLNERKLKQGFHQVFDTTVFGYLQDHRLEQARQLLQTQQLNIQETARWVGYASRSSFVVAFKKKFQIAPSQYLKGENSRGNLC
ncbi:MAG: AraC family transcriptional regulator [Cyanobacteria bacterium P01_D01_bin.71]